ncbi:four-carbon acid sugar kinase family protein [Castellaniella sp. S9]|uniref:four-carbon acid sugar kinase family protein n=1 Tax=Castellaniella sp. S9 TaxID=2993652 RepID=UPI0022B2B115|nr:four-carbon acid sugar kinase family protein [Castellaniella sp. S9]
MSIGSCPHDAGVPAGLLLGWCGDDFTGSAAVMEVLGFSGLPARLFLRMPTPGDLAAAPHLRAFGVATTARTYAPWQMQAEFPALFHAFRDIGAPLFHYKVCSTLDSSERTGSIGCAADIGLEVFPASWAPVLVAAPPMGRYQAFGTLFAEAFGSIHRLDRHPVMRRHPVTPMDEADVACHLARQTAHAVACLDLAGFADAADRLARLRQGGARLITLDAIDQDTLAVCGELLWTHRRDAPFVIGSQGVEYALIAYWIRQGWLPPAQPVPSAGRAEAMVVVSGSVSPVTQRQIDWAQAHGFEGIPLDPVALMDPASSQLAERHAVSAALEALGRGLDPLIHTARGPDDPRVQRFQGWIGRAGTPIADANVRIGSALGRVLDRILEDTGVRRAVISGGDTSGHAVRELDILALEPLAPTIPGASVCTVIANNHLDGLQLALKGGQMGSEDYFGWVREGGGAR